MPILRFVLIVLPIHNGGLVRRAGLPCPELLSSRTLSYRTAPLAQRICKNERLSLREERRLSSVPVPALLPGVVELDAAQRN